MVAEEERRRRKWGDSVLDDIITAGEVRDEDYIRWSSANDRISMRRRYKNVKIGKLDVHIALRHGYGLCRGRCLSHNQ